LLTVQRQEIATQEDLNQKLRAVEREVVQAINTSKDKADPCINDHGAEHGKRVAQHMETVEDVLEDISLAGSYLDRPLTPEEKFILKVAAHTHDIGRAFGADENHPQVSAEYIRNNTGLPLTDAQRRVIALLTLLHADGVTRRMFGTDDLAELARRGMISKREAYLASILRVADALDLGKKRIRHNTRGDSQDDTLKLINNLPPRERMQKLSHLNGHRGIYGAYFSNRNGRLTLEITLDKSELPSHGRDVANRIRDLLRDNAASIVDKQYTVRFSGLELQAVQQWYDENQDTLYEELEGMDVKIGGA